MSLNSDYKVGWSLLPRAGVALDRVDVSHLIIRILIKNVTV